MLACIDRKSFLNIYYADIIACIFDSCCISSLYVALLYHHSTISWNKTSLNLKRSARYLNMVIEKLMAHWRVLRRLNQKIRVASRWISQIMLTKCMHRGVNGTVGIIGWIKKVIISIIVIETWKRWLKTLKINVCMVCRNCFCQVIDNWSRITTQNGQSWRQIECNNSIDWIKTTCSSISWLTSKTLDNALEMLPSYCKFDWILLHIPWILYKRKGIKRMNMFVAHCVQLIFMIELMDIIRSKSTWYGMNECKSTSNGFRIFSSTQVDVHIMNGII